MTQAKKAVKRQKKAVLVQTIKRKKKRRIIKRGRIPNIFAQFAGEDSALLQALQDYDLMRQEKHKELTDTMRRSLCEQLNSEFQPCEWAAVVNQSTMRGWMKFYPLDEPKPQQSQQRPLTAEEEYTRLFNEVCGGGTP